MRRSSVMVSTSPGLTWSAGLRRLVAIDAHAARHWPASRQASAISPRARRTATCRCAGGLPPSAIFLAAAGRAALRAWRRATADRPAPAAPRAALGLEGRLRPAIAVARAVAPVGSRRHRLAACPGGNRGGRLALRLGRTLVAVAVEFRLAGRSSVAAVAAFAAAFGAAAGHPARRCAAASPARRAAAGRWPPRWRWSGGAARAGGRNGPAATAGWALALRPVRRRDASACGGVGASLARAAATSSRLPRRAARRGFGRRSSLAASDFRRASTVSGDLPALQRRGAQRVSATLRSRGATGCLERHRSALGVRLDRFGTATASATLGFDRPRLPTSARRSVFGRRPPRIGARLRLLRLAACRASASAAALRWPPSRLRPWRCGAPPRALPGRSPRAWPSPRRRLRLGAIAETLQDLFHVVGVGAEDRHHRRRHHEGRAVIGAVRTRAEPGLPGQRRPDEIGQPLQDVDAHGAAAERRGSRRACRRRGRRPDR